MDAPISAERLSGLVGLIYDCAIDPAQWPIAMEAIRAELNFHNSTLDLLKLPSGDALSNATINVPPNYLAMMAGAGPDVLDAWGGAQKAMTLPLDRPAVLTHVNPEFDMERTTNRYVVAFAKPQGIFDVLAIGLARDARAIGTISFGRHKSAGPIGEREIAVAYLLIPHLQRAATINRMLDGAALARATFETTLDLVAVPILLVNASGHIIHANPAARHLLDRATLIRSVDGLLSAATLGASSALNAAIAQAAQDESVMGRRGLGIPVSGQDEAFGALHVLPLRRTQAGIASGPVAAVFVAQADTPFVAPTQIVTALFDLTPAEARVFDHLVAGHTTATIAAALGVGQSTIKTHVLRIYAKIGVHRQADLVRIAASLAIPVMA